jgi:hypothetical protein
MTNVTASHKTLLSLVMLVGAAFVAQGVADSSPEAHTAVLLIVAALIVGLGMHYMTTNSAGQVQPAGPLADLAGYPWTPPKGG